MAERKPLVIVGGRVQEIPNGDSLPATTGRGTTAQKPAASTANTGWLYFDTTLGKMQRSNGTTWEDCEGAGGESSGGVSLGMVLALG